VEGKIGIRSGGLLGGGSHYNGTDAAEKVIAPGDEGWEFVSVVPLDEIGISD